MTKYDVTIKGLESGLTANAIEGTIIGQFPDAEGVEVTESVED